MHTHPTDAPRHRLAAAPEQGSQHQIQEQQQHHHHPHCFRPTEQEEELELDQQELELDQQEEELDQQEEELEQQEEELEQQEEEPDRQRLETLVNTLNAIHGLTAEDLPCFSERQGAAAAP